MELLVLELGCCCGYSFRVVTIHDHTIWAPAGSIHYSGVYPFSTSSDVFQPRKQSFQYEYQYKIWKATRQNAKTKLTRLEIGSGDQNQTNSTLKLI